MKKLIIASLAAIFLAPGCRCSVEHYELEWAAKACEGHQGIRTVRGTLFWSGHAVTCQDGSLFDVNRQVPKKTDSKNMP